MQMNEKKHITRSNKHPPVPRFAPDKMEGPIRISGTVIFLAHHGMLLEKHRIKETQKSSLRKQGSSKYLKALDSRFRGNDRTTQNWIVITKDSPRKSWIVQLR